MEISIPGVNTEKGLGLCDGDESIYVGILRLFIYDMTKALNIMRNVSEITLNAYAVGAHSAKSISEVIGAEEARNAAKLLEDMAKSGDLAGVLDRNGVFVKYAGDLIDSIKDWLEKYDQQMPAN